MFVGYCRSVDSCVYNKKLGGLFGGELSLSHIDALVSELSEPQVLQDNPVGEQ